MIVDALKGKYSLPSLLEQFKLPEGGYYYRGTSLKGQDKYSGIRKRISTPFNESNGRYGYRRIRALFSHEKTVISEKVVYRIVAEEETVARVKSRRNYNSFQG